MPPLTEVNMTAPLSAFASASAPKPAVPSQDIWEMLGTDGNALVDAFDPVTDITGLRVSDLPANKPCAVGCRG